MRQLDRHTAFSALQLGLLLLIMLIIQSSPALTAQLAFSRQAIIGQNEYWRLLSGHLGHTNWQHLLLNSVALISIYLLHHQHYHHLWLRLLYLGTVVGATLYRLNPELSYYLGLSGILHGLLAWGSVEDIGRRWYSGAIILLIAGLKVIFEQRYGANPATAKLIEASVAIDAHLYGFLAGLGAGVMQQLGKRWPAT